jgi:hypothetical protein
MASLTVTPSEVQVGDAVVITGAGFAADSVVTVTIPEYGESFETVSDAAGGISTDDLADRAITTLTSTGVNVTAADTVTIGAVTYTFRAAVTTTANEVKIGADAAATLQNLKDAINLTGTTAQYGSLTVVHPTVTAAAITTTTLRMYAKTAGTGGNSLASTKSAVTLSFTGSTFAGGAASTGVSSLLYTPTKNEPFTVQATDGTNTASARVLVFSH